VEGLTAEGQLQKQKEWTPRKNARTPNFENDGSRRFELEQHRAEIDLMRAIRTTWLPVLPLGPLR
jgi:hypothetical protein